jgi:hypothetical protein
MCLGALIRVCRRKDQRVTIFRAGANCRASARIRVQRQRRDLPGQRSPSHSGSGSRQPPSPANSRMRAARGEAWPDRPVVPAAREGRGFQELAATTGLSEAKDDSISAFPCQPGASRPVVRPARVEMVDPCCRTGEPGTSSAGAGRQHWNRSGNRHCGNLRNRLRSSPGCKDAEAQHRFGPTSWGLSDRHRAKKDNRWNLASPLR